MFGELKLGVRSALIATMVAVVACIFAGSAQAITAVQTQWSNTNLLVINDDADASPYPSTIDVSGAPTSGYSVQVMLHNFSHTYFRDTQLVLEAPDGTFTSLLRDNDNPGAADNVELGFANGGADLPAGDLASGTYAPVESPFSGGGTFDSPAPSPSGGTSADPLYGNDLGRVAHGDPNGTWKLFARDIAGLDDGVIQGGWTLTIAPDTTAPTVQVDNPTDGQYIEQGTASNASFNCSDNGALTDCSADVDGTPISSGDPLPTNTPGTHTFTATATDSANNSTTVVDQYVVEADTTNPTVTIDSPTDGQSVSQGSHPKATFSCSDNVEVASCDGVVDGNPISSGQNLPTDTPGTHTLTVTATDTSGNTASDHHDYVVGPDTTDPTIDITTPTDGLHYVQDEHAPAVFSCADDVHVASCTASVDGGSSFNSGDDVPTGSTGAHTLTVTATDDTGNTATSSVGYTVDAGTAGNHVYSNRQQLTLPGSGVAAVYPSTIDVSGAPTSNYQVSVVLHGFDHHAYTDTHFLLQAPDGHYTALLEMSGFGTVDGDIAFADNGTPLNDQHGDLAPGTYTPAEWSNKIAFAAPAPVPPVDPYEYGASLARVGGGDPNGTWKLYEQDLSGGITGQLTSGWSVVIGPDTIAPKINITSPSDGENISQNADKDATFTCTDNVASNPSCTGDVDGTPISSGDPLPTGTLGTHTLTVNSSDGNGNNATAHVNYNVAVDAHPPTISSRVANHAYLVKGEHVDDPFSCADDVGVQSCTATVDGNALNLGDPLPTGLRGTHTFTITASDAGGNTTTRTTSYVVGTPEPGQTFGNRAAMTINDNNRATPYPSKIHVSGAPTSGYLVRVTLHGFSHTYFRDTHLLLQAPDGSVTTLLQQSDDPGAASNATVTFADGAPAMPTSGNLTSGTYAPAETVDTQDFPPPAPPSSDGQGHYGADLSAVAHGDPNGTWKLYAVDIASPDSGRIATGWDLNIRDSSGSAPASTSTPKISGTTTNGQTLTAGHGDWSGNPDVYDYRWLRCDTAGGHCVGISGTDANDGDNSYTLQGADSGHRIKADVTAYNGVGSATKRSSSTAIVDAPISTAAPQISGTDDVGQTLTTSDGTWNPTPASYAYSWQRCDADGSNCAAIGTTDATDDNAYTLTAADGGHQIRVKVTATNSAGSASRYSSRVSIGKPQVVDRPTISGTPQVGQVQTSSGGTWDPPASSYSYRWYRCDSAGSNCVAISSIDATDGDSTYTAVAADAGHRLRTVVTPDNAVGKTTATSLPTRVIQP